MFIILVNILGFIPNWIHTGEYVSEKRKKNHMMSRIKICISDTDAIFFIYNIV
jgi:hypothetical protein